MDQLLPDLYSQFGKYINQFRSFPHFGDGLKIVERRMFLSLNQMAKNFTKSANVVGHCLGSWHPHGDSSAYETLVNLVNDGLAEGQGNFGSNVGIDSNPPAAQRYTEVRCSKFVLDLAFENIDYVPHEYLEYNEKEPVLLPTKLPFCFLGEKETQGIGFGYSTMIPVFKCGDLVKRLEWLLGRREEEPIPMPKTDCKIISSRADIKNLLNNGKQRLVLQGKCFKDTDKKSVIVTSVPPSKSFSALLKSLDKEISQDKSVGFQDESTTSTKVRFVIKRPRMIKQDQLLKKIQDKLQGSITFECNVCGINGEVKSSSVDEMLLNTYKLYKKIEDHVLKQNVQNIQNEIDTLQTIQKCKPCISSALREKPDDIEYVIQKIMTANIVQDEDFLRKIFNKFTITKLFNISTDTNQLEQKKKELLDNINNLENYLWNEKYNQLKGV